MSFTDIVLVLEYADSDTLAIAQKWLEENELKDRAARLLVNVERYDVRLTAKRVTGRA